MTRSMKLMQLSILSMALSTTWARVGPVRLLDEEQGCVCDVLVKPDIFNKEKTARWMAHSLDWGVLSTISTRLNGIADQEPVPFGNVYSFVDGTCDNSTGIPYLYGTYMDQSFVDSLKNSAVSLTLSEASIATTCRTKKQQGEIKAACSIHGSPHGDAENPLCARLTLTGTLEQLKIEENYREYKFAQQALFERHASMKEWPANHEWIIAKINIQDIWLIDFFGGASMLNVSDYLNADLQPAKEEESALLEEEEDGQ